MTVQVTTRVFIDEEKFDKLLAAAADYHECHISELSDYDISEFLNNDMTDNIYVRKNESFAEIEGIETDGWFVSDMRISDLQELMEYKERKYKSRDRDDMERD